MYLVRQGLMQYDREFLTGTVGVLILSLLSERAMYGYEILQEAERRSAKQFQMKEGTIYPALHQMERAGFLKAAWREGESGRARKYYSLTAKGRRHAASKRRQWDAISAAMRAILGDARA
ncbi:MAG: helix-turn-helix transcriptional regulator [Gemmatimonadota bacterium]